MNSRCKHKYEYVSLVSRENKLRHKHKAEHKKRKTRIIELMSMLSSSSFPRWNKESHARALLYCALVHLTSFQTEF